MITLGVRWCWDSRPLRILFLAKTCSPCISDSCMTHVHPPWQCHGFKNAPPCNVCRTLWSSRYKKWSFSKTLILLSLIVKYQENSTVTPLHKSTPLWVREGREQQQQQRRRQQQQQQQEEEEEEEEGEEEEELLSPISAKYSLGYTDPGNKIVVGMGTPTFH